MHSLSKCSNFLRAHRYKDSFAIGFSSEAIKFTLDPKIEFCLCRYAGCEKMQSDGVGGSLGSLSEKSRHTAGTTHLVGT